MNSEGSRNPRRYSVYKTQEFEAYALWKSLPSFLRGQPRQVLEKSGIDEEIMLGLLELKTQGDFARKFDIKDLGTLTDWNKKLEKEGLLSHIHAWARKLTPNVIFALYRNASKNGKAADVKAWMETVEGM